MRFDSLPVFETVSLRLRPITIHDVVDLFEYGKDPEVSKYTTWEPSQSLSETERLVKEWIVLYEQNKAAPWAIVEKKSGRVIGTVEVRNYDSVAQAVEIGYALSPVYWGRGYMLQAVTVIVNHLFSTTPIVEIYATVHSENSRSKRILEKIGMQQDCSWKQCVERKGIFVCLERWYLRK